VEPTVDLRGADCENLPYADDSFDIVYSWGIVHHTPDTQRALAEIVRVCRPGGTCKVMVYHRHSLLAIYLWIGWALFRGRPWRPLTSIVGRYMESSGTKAFTRAEIARMLSRLPIHTFKIATALSRDDALLLTRNDE
jgi:ubiquinone/menaquinone biosynthesis C-methylase UbiE